MELPGKTTYIELPEEARAKIQATAEIIADTTDEQSAKDLLDVLNMYLLEANLIGAEVRLSSEALAISSFRIGKDDIILEPIYDPAILLLETADGVLGACTYVNLEDQNILMYTVEMPVGSDGVIFYSASAPVEVASVTRELISSLPEVDEETLEIGELLGAIAGIKEEGYQGELESLIELLDEFDINDIGHVRMLGRLSSWMMGHDEAKNNNTILMSILKIVTHKLHVKGTFSFNGYEYLNIVKDKREAVTRQPIDVTEGKIEGIVAVYDFEMDGFGGDQFEDTLQPALLVLDETSQKEVWLPIKHLKAFVNIGTISTNDRMRPVAVGARAIGGRNIDCSEAMVDFKTQYKFPLGM